MTPMLKLECPSCHDGVVGNQHTNCAATGTVPDVTPQLVDARATTVYAIWR